MLLPTNGYHALNNAPQRSPRGTIRYTGEIEVGFVSPKVNAKD